MEKELIESFELLDIKKSSVQKGRFGESYVVDNSTGTKYIMPTKRPDGTLRKEIKVRPGYVPPEERQVYIPVHKRQGNKPTSEKGVVSKDPEISKLDEPNKAAKNVESVNTEPKPVKTYAKNMQFKNKSRAPKQKPKAYLSKSAPDASKCESNLSSTETGDANKLDNATKPEDKNLPENNKPSQKSDNDLIDRKFKNSLHNTLKKIREVKLLQEKHKKGLELDANQQKKINRLPELEAKLNELNAMDKWDLKYV
ncbi:exon junction complex protein [Theileria orientalis]|uniref:Exon junction complex protein n=1 Tax=Theileria orientalis TaxID=68886 RepID=A0A976M576_THEOR|nr:exon junction complex protein [Theileria orientalis]